LLGLSEFASCLLILNPLMKVTATNEVTKEGVRFEALRTNR
jgi:hypothetical protein